MFNKKYFITFFFFVVIFLFIFIFHFNNQNKFIIKKLIDPFYFIPKDKKGIKVKNLDKKILNVLDNNKLDTNFDNDIYLKFSFQLFTSDNYEEISKKLDYFISIYKIQKKDLYVASLTTNIEKEFFILYKNFDTREAALNNCSNSLKLLNKCIIVNVENMN